MAYYRNSGINCDRRCRMRIPEKPPPEWMTMVQSAAESGEDSPLSFFRQISRAEVQECVRKANDEYLHWDRLRFQALPDGLDARHAWAAVEVSRSSQLKPLPLTFYKQPFKYWVPPQHQE